MNLKDMFRALDAIHGSNCMAPEAREAAGRANDLLTGFRAARDLSWELNAANLHSLAQGNDLRITIDEQRAEIDAMQVKLAQEQVDHQQRVDHLNGVTLCADRLATNCLALLCCVEPARDWDEAKAARAVLRDYDLFKTQE